MAEVTRKGRQTIQNFIENELAPEIQQKWRGNLEDSQQSLAQDIQVFTDSNIVQVGSRNEVLKFLEWGTRPHIIKPDEAQALRWFNEEGEPVFATKVKHPGFEPYAHMRSAVDRLRVELK